jgi:phosphoribosyl 1,2-cyclic phosphodiesterase
MLSITSLNSGSNGNCYYIGNCHEAVLIDAGLSCRETEKRMKRLELEMGQVKAIFISHEHGDHIHGLPVIARKYQIPVYINHGTLRNSRMLLEGCKVNNLNQADPVIVGNLLVKTFSKHHDAADPVSFTISGSNVTVGIFTDIGQPCEQLIHHFRQCHAAFLEANYDEEMLANGGYPIHLKRRISGGKGHLSNRQALELFLAHRPPFMSHLLLAHLSKNNNSPELAHALFSPHAGKTQVTVATRYKETDIFQIAPDFGKASSATTNTKPVKATQMALF